MVKSFRKLMKDNPDTNSETSMNLSKRSRNKITQAQYGKTTKTQRQRENILGLQKSDCIQGRNTQNES